MGEAMVPRQRVGGVMQCAPDHRTGSSRRRIFRYFLSTMPTTPLRGAS